MKISVYIGMSLDGFIAREDGGLDFLDFFSDIGEDYGYKEFMESVDCLLMGRNTFEKVISFSSWPYEKPVYVLSSGRLDIPDELKKNVFSIKGSPVELVSILKSKGYSKIYLDGGITISNFIKEDLVCDITITRLPFLLSVGIPLFRDFIGEKKLKHISTKVYPSGLTQSVYEFEENKVR